MSDPFKFSVSGVNGEACVYAILNEAGEEISFYVTLNGTRISGANFLKLADAEVFAQRQAGPSSGFKI